jgi:hypothetical protein
VTRLWPDSGLYTVYPVSPVPNFHVAPALQLPRIVRLYRAKIIETAHAAVRIRTVMSTLDELAADNLLEETGPICSR